MKQLHSVRAQVRSLGHCALVGTLAGLLSAQAFASGLNEAVNSSNQPVNAAAASGAITAPVAAPTLAANGSSSSLDRNALPSAPEVAKIEAPAPLDPIVSEAAQDGQSLTSAPAPRTKKVQRPGMLALGIAGLAPIALGAYFYSYPTKNTSVKDEYGTILLAPGVAMSALGFFFAFHQKKN